MMPASGLITETVRRGTQTENCEELGGGPANLTGSRLTDYLNPSETNQRP